MAAQTHSGRVSRPGRAAAQSGNKGRYARAKATPRRSTPKIGLRRRQPQPTGVKKVVQSVLPASAAKKATPNSKAGKAGGVALLAAAAGVAFKNRDKLVSQVKQRTGSDDTPAAGTPPVNATPTTATHVG